MADNHNMKKAVKIVMRARAMGILWKLVLQIILDRPSTIVNAWNNMDKRADPCPAKIWYCIKCNMLVKAVGSDGRCGRCTPGANF